jgi:carbamoyltransferase
VVILGIADGLDSGAALVINGEVVAATTQGSLDRAARSRVFPWGAMSDVLEAAGLGRGDVDLVAVAGRFTPPLVLRRYPALREIAGDNPFSPALDAHVAYQAALRWTGFGAFQEDQTADWFQRQLTRRGYAPQRVLMVDMHRALAEAAYRCQPHDDVLAVTAHPKADGASVAVFRARGGMLVPRFRDSALSVLNTHLQRCAGALGLDAGAGLGLLWAEAGRALPDPELVELLSGRLTSVGRRTSRRAYPVPDDLALLQSVYDRLRTSYPAVAAASVLENLVDALGGLVRTHALREGARRVVLGGALFENPRLVARIAEGLDIDELFVLPEPGTRSLPLGAAAEPAGLAPRRTRAPGFGRAFGAHQCALALEAAGLVAEDGDAITQAARALVEGGAVARFVGPGGAGRWGGGSRSVLVRADDPAAVARARDALGRDPREEPGCVWDGVDGSFRAADRVPDGLRLGAVALRADDGFRARHAAVVAPDGRVLVKRVDADEEPALAALIAEVRRLGGPGALACWPLGVGAEPPAARPGDAVRAWRHAGIAGLLLEDRLVLAERA